MVRELKVGDEIIPKHNDARFISNGKIHSPVWKKNGRKHILAEVDKNKGLIRLSEDRTAWHFMDDWKVYTEESLSDEIDYRPIEYENGVSTSGRLPPSKVKTAVKKLLDYLENSKQTCDAPLKGPTGRDNVLEMVSKKAKEIFGDKLI